MSVARFNRLSEELSTARRVRRRRRGGRPGAGQHRATRRAGARREGRPGDRHPARGRPAPGRGRGAGAGPGPRRPDRDRGRRRHRRGSSARPVSSARPSRRSSLRGRTARCRTPGPAAGGWLLEDGVVLDFGGVYDGYCVDLTRTVELGPPLRSWRRLAERGRRSAAGGDRGGPPGNSGERGRRRGARRARAARSRGGVRPCDRPRPRARGARGAAHRPAAAGQPDALLEPGMVFTIEPGAYVEGVGGVRLEDDVLVTRSRARSADAAADGARGIRRLIGIRRHRTDPGAGQAARPGGVRARAGRPEAADPQGRAAADAASRAGAADAAAPTCHRPPLRRSAARRRPRCRRRPTPTRRSSSRSSSRRSSARSTGRPSPARRRSSRSASG